LYDLGFSLPAPFPLYYDKLSATYIYPNPVQYDNSKHIAMDYHFAWELVANGDVVICYFPTHLQVADIFTNG